MLERKQEFVISVDQKDPMFKFIKDLFATKTEQVVAPQIDTKNVAKAKTAKPRPPKKPVSKTAHKPKK